MTQDWTVRRVVTGRGDVIELRMIDGNLRRVVNGHIVAKGGDGAEYLKAQA